MNMPDALHPVPPLLQQAPITQDVDRSMLTLRPLSERPAEANRPSALGMLQAANASRALACDRAHNTSSWNVMSDTESDEEDHEIICSSPVNKEPELAEVIRKMESSFSELE